MHTYEVKFILNGHSYSEIINATSEANARKLIMDRNPGAHYSGTKKIS